jgi:hypothetical protein
LHQQGTTENAAEEMKGERKIISRTRLNVLLLATGGDSGFAVSFKGVEKGK